MAHSTEGKEGDGALLGQLLKADQGGDEPALHGWIDALCASLGPDTELREVQGYEAVLARLKHREPRASLAAQLVVLRSRAELWPGFDPAAQRAIRFINGCPPTQALERLRTGVTVSRARWHLVRGSRRRGLAWTERLLNDSDRHQGGHAGHTMAGLWAMRAGDLDRAVERLGFALVAYEAQVEEVTGPWRGLFSSLRRRGVGSSVLLDYERVLQLWHTRTVWAAPYDTFCRHWPDWPWWRPLADVVGDARKSPLHEHALSAHEERMRRLLRSGRPSGQEP